MTENYELYRRALDGRDYKTAMGIACENPDVMGRVTLMESYRLIHESEIRLETGENILFR